jgi:hypothetical protein
MVAAIAVSKQINGAVANAGSDLTSCATGVPRSASAGHWSSATRPRQLRRGVRRRQRPAAGLSAVVDRHGARLSHRARASRWPGALFGATGRAKRAPRHYLRAGNRAPRQAGHLVAVEELLVLAGSNAAATTDEPRYRLEARQ